MVPAVEIVSVKSVLCDKMKEDSAEILTLFERALPFSDTNDGRVRPLQPKTLAHNGLSHGYERFHS